MLLPRRRADKLQRDIAAGKSLELFVIFAGGADFLGKILISLFPAPPFVPCVHPPLHLWVFFVIK